jgi:uncharacterized protein DUF6600
MKTTRIMLLAASLLGALPMMGSAQPSISAGLHIGPSGRANVDIGFFYDDLASYGNWIQRPRYGWVWTPRVATRSWRPYENGHWVWTDLGWTWVSNESFGWATYHYGRWYDDPDYGWEWVPGNQWAPAWVDWHASNDYVGWAPLPPSYDYRPGVTVNVDLAPEDFVFVPQARFLDTRLVNYAVPSWQCGQIYRGTRSYTRYQNFNNQVFNAGFPVDRVQQWTGRRVQRYQVADLGWNQRHQGGRFAQNRVAFFRPQVENARVAAPSARPIARRAVLAGAAAVAAVSAHHAFRAAQANHQPQGLLRQQERAQRQAQVQGQALTRQQFRLQGRQQQQAQVQARLQRQQGRSQRQALVQQQQQGRQQQRFQRQQQQQAQQQGRQQRQQAQVQARLQQQQSRAQRQAQVQQQQQGRQQQRFQRQQQQQAQQQGRQQRQQAQAQGRWQQQQGQAMRQQQQQARQQQRSQQQQARAQWQQQRQAQAQQRPQRPQRQQAQQQARQQRQGNPGQQGQGGNHHRQRPPQ